MKNRALNNKIFLKGLVVGCPMGKPVSDCPLNGLRTIPMEKLNETVNGLANETVDKFFKVHAECFKKRTKDRELTR